MLLLAALAAASVSSVAPLTQRLLHLDRTVSAASHAEPVIDACLSVCAVLHGKDSDFSAQELVAATPTKPNLLEYHFSEGRLHDLLHNALAGAATDDMPALLDVASAVAASARFTLLPSSEVSKVVDTLASILGSDDFLEQRREALSAVRAAAHHPLTGGGGHSAPLGPPTAEYDEQLAAALYRVCMDALGPRVLAPHGFPSSFLGVRCLAAAALEAGGGLRASASLASIWHASDGAAPMIVRRAAAAESRGSTRGRRSLVVAFSSLGWHGLMRAEWGLTIAAACADVDADVDVVHALDPTRSWFCADPMSGALDGGAWWDAALAELCAPYDSVSLIGESMGATAALRFGRHVRGGGGESGGGGGEGGGGGCVGRVVALVPQIDLRDFDCCTRADMTAAHKDELRAAIARACDELADGETDAQATDGDKNINDARVVIHVGREADDLHQLSYLPRVVAGYEAIGEDATDPLPRDGTSASRAVGCGRVRVVKHDVEGHALGAGLKAQGRLHSSVGDDLFFTPLSEGRSRGGGGGGGIRQRRAVGAAVSSRAPLVQMSAQEAAEEAAEEEEAMVEEAEVAEEEGAAEREAGTPIAVCTECKDWVAEAAASLEVHGFCVLTSIGNEPLVPREVCSACRVATEAHLEDLLERASRRGFERDDEFRFAELVHRDGLRYDMPLDWHAGEPNDARTRRLVAAAFEGDDEAAFDQLHGAVDAIARPAMEAVVARAKLAADLPTTLHAEGEREGSSDVSSSRGVGGVGGGDSNSPAGDSPAQLDGSNETPMAGCVISSPGASTQAWHSDGSAYGLFNVFVPLLPLTKLNGPTEIRPGTHRNAGWTRGLVAPRTAPLLGAGDVLIFDYRCRHRGLANGGDEPRPVAYVTYAIDGAEDRHNFPDASTLAFD